MITDRVTLAGLTVDGALPVANIRLGTYVAGGNGGTGVAPAGFPANACGLSYSFTSESPAAALNGLDHHWLQSVDVPKVVDFGAAVNTAIVFVAVDHGPFPEEGIESTVWGSDSPSLVGFPSGWTQATLTTIWRRGWEDPPQCEPGDNADDFTAQYSFPGDGFRYVAVHANYSISIFDDPSHQTWVTDGDDAGWVPGWQSGDDEIDAIGTPGVCNEIVADAGPDQQAAIGQQLCFDGSGSSCVDGPCSFCWDLDDDGECDASGAAACVSCDAAREVNARLFVTDTAACVAQDTAIGTCTASTPTAWPEDVAFGGTEASAVFLAGQESGLEVWDRGTSSRIGGLAGSAFGCPASPVAGEPAFFADGLMLLPDGARALLSAGRCGAFVLDVSNPRSPSRGARIVLPSWTEDADVVTFAGHELALFATQFGGLQIVDLAAPSQIVGSIGRNDAGFGRGIAVNGRVQGAQLRVYVATTTGLRIVDATNPAAPVLVGRLDAATVEASEGLASGLLVPQDVAVFRGKAYVPAWQGGLLVVDVSSPAAPSVHQRLPAPAGSATYKVDVSESASRAYVTQGIAGLSIYTIGMDGTLFANSERAIAAGLASGADCCWAWSVDESGGEVVVGFGRFEQPGSVRRGGFQIPDVSASFALASSESRCGFLGIEACGVLLPLYAWQRRRSRTC